MALNNRYEAFCHSCGVPIGTTATLDPLRAIQAEGFVIRKALDGRPRVIVLMGIWVMFLPLLVVSVGAASYLITNRRGLADFVFFWIFVGLSYVSFVALYRVTRNYLTIPARKDDALESGAQE
jgi:hypothetical protein